MKSEIVSSHTSRSPTVALCGTGIHGSAPEPKSLQFEGLQYSVRHGPRGPSIGIQIGRHWIFKWIVEAAFTRALQTLSTSDSLKLHTAQALYDDQDWPSFGFGRRIAIGRCIRLFADRQMLPIRVVNPKATGTKKYMHIGPQGVPADLGIQLRQAGCQPN